MKKYLEDLEKELKKLKMSDLEISDILNDHKEMIAAAKDDGVTDEELEEKFGNPERVAKELKDDTFDASFNTKDDKVYGTDEFEEYELFKTFPVSGDVTNVLINLISEDVVFYPYEGNEIKIFAKDMKNPDDYEIVYIDNQLIINRKNNKLFKMFSNNNSANFGIMIPLGLDLASFEVKNISGDYEVKSVNAIKFEFKSTSGDVELENIHAKDFNINTVSGDLELENCSAEDMEISLVSGDCDMEKIDVNNKITINSVSGDVDAEAVKCQHLSFRTVSGDFEGKEVYPESVDLKSVSGDISISNSNKDHKIDVKSKKTLSGDVTIN